METITENQKHTKGEWKVKVGNYPNSYFLESIVQESEAEANAHLIAAAPDMLEALELIFDSGVMINDKLTVKAISAIRKAKGL